MENVLVNNRVKPNVYVARSLLQEQDWRFLRLVMLCGGYFTRSQAARLKLRAIPKASYQQIRLLEWLGLVKPRRLSLDPRCPHVYKLTARALHLLGNRDSHIRRAHSLAAIQRKLLTVQFVAEHKDRQIRLALSLEKKIQAFESLGFLKELLPEKKPRGRQVTACDQVIGTDGLRIYIYYIDRLTRPAQAELRGLLRAYARAIASGGSCLKLIIVVATGERARVYRFLLDEVRKLYATELAVHRIESWPFSVRREALVVQSV